VSPGRIRRLFPFTPFDRLGRRLGCFCCALATAATVVGCGPPTSGRSALELYGEHCARCHGADGRGDPRVLGLSPNSDLTRSPLVRRKARGPIFQTISQGADGMPAFGHKLELGDTELLIDYVLALPAPGQQSQTAR